MIYPYSQRPSATQRINFYLTQAMAAPTSNLLSSTLYHGTPIEAHAQAILKEGIKSQDVTCAKKTKGFLAPVKGKVYLTQDLNYALLYLLGGSYVGHNPIESVIKKDGQFGYLFVVPGTQLKDVQPDEDSIGDFIHENQAESPNRYRYDYVPDFGGNPSDVNYAKKYTVWNYLKQNVTENQFRKSTQGEMPWQAVAGKTALKNMPDNIKLLLIELGAHIAHTGTVHPSECWQFDKLKSKQLTVINSNFFSLAERLK